MVTFVLANTVNVMSLLVCVDWTTVFGPCGVLSFVQYAYK